MIMDQSKIIMLIFLLIHSKIKIQKMQLSKKWILQHIEAKAQFLIHNLKAIMMKKYQNK